MIKVAEINVAYSFGRDAICCKSLVMFDGLKYLYILMN
jgi:hypothetical protein